MKDQALADVADTEAWSTPPPPKRAHSRRARTKHGRSLRILLCLLGVLAATVLLVTIGGVWVNSHLHGAGGGEVDVVVAPGTTSSQLAHMLDRQGVVSDGWLFAYYLRYERVGVFDRGSYVFHAREGYDNAVRDLRSGPRIPASKVTIPEGFTVAQIADRIGRLPGRSSTRFLALATSGSVRSRYEPHGTNNLEGLVFPDTYVVRDTDSDEAILQQMVNEFDRQGTAAGLDQTQAGRLSNGLTPYETIIAASLIEREAKVAVDRPKIARVIVNRLERNLKLQIDATVLYALGRQTAHLSTHDTEVNSPFNTYRIAGLPPSPIANPGRDSLLGALSPTPGPWLYYVLANADGHHAFATTPKEFTVLVSQARAKGLL